MSALAQMQAAEPAGVPPMLALEVFQDLSRSPDRYIVHCATDNSSAPLIVRGDVVVVDIGGAAVTGGWMPREGGLFLIEYCSPPVGGEIYARRSRNIVQTYTDQRGSWWAGGMRRCVHGREIICSDGPYADEAALADKLIGTVIGLYRPQGVIR